MVRIPVLEDLNDLEALRPLPWDELVHALLGWLTGPDRRRQRLARIMLTALGRDVVPDLRRELVRCTGLVGQRLRLWEVLAAIGTPRVFLRA